MKMFNYLNQKQINDLMVLLCIGNKIDEIVRIIGGSKDSEPARLHAMDMIENAKRYKTN